VKTGKYKIENINIGDEIIYENERSKDHSTGKVISKLDQNIFIERKGILGIEIIIIEVPAIISLIKSNSL
jgi:hypothetical protein